MSTANPIVEVTLIPFLYQNQQSLDAAIAAAEQSPDEYVVLDEKFEPAFPPVERRKMTLWQYVWRRFGNRGVWPGVKLEV